MKRFIISLLFFVFLTLAHSQTPSDYSWRNIPIGGGGYITGMRIHPATPHEKYFRTDVGGAYRYSSDEGRLEQLFNFGPELKNYYSVAGITFDPNDPNSVIMAVDRRCSLTESAIIVSDDKGEEWTEISVPFYFAANGGRDCTGNDTDKDREGNCIEVNPLATNEVYIGSRDLGLWILDLDDPANPTQVSSVDIPVNSERQSIRSVSFHPVQQQYVFIAYAGHGIYMGNTSDGTWQKIDNDIQDLESSVDISFSLSGNIMYVACKDKGIYKCDNPTAANRSWNQVLSYPGTNTNGYLTVTASPHDENTVATIWADYNSLQEFHWSTDAGSNWTVRDGEMATNIFPWKSSGFVSNIGQVVFDPVDQDKVYMVGFFGSYETADITTDPIPWSNAINRGHEEVVSIEGLAMPTNSAQHYLLLMDADHTGFIYQDISIDNFPSHDLRSLIDDDTNTIKGGTSAFCESNSDRIVSCFPQEWSAGPAALAYSDDGGLSYTRSTSYDETWGKSVIAISSQDPDRLVVANEFGLKWEDRTTADAFQSASGTSDVNGNCSTISFNCLGASDVVDDELIKRSVFSVYRPLAADPVMGCTFYLYDQFSGTFHVSTDFGESWCLVNNGLPVVPSIWTHKTHLTTIPAHAGHLYLNFKNQLLHSSDGGQSWITIPQVQDALCFGFGKEAPGATYPALYVWGKANGDATQRAYTSWDGGSNWNQINDPATFNVGSPHWIMGDRNVHGQVYFGCGGQGTFVGKYAGSCFGDVNGDLVVDVDDFLALNTAFGTMCQGCGADLTEDGEVDINDFLLLNSQFGNDCN